MRTGAGIRRRPTYNSPRNQAQCPVYGSHFEKVMATLPPHKFCMGEVDLAGLPLTRCSDAKQFRKPIGSVPAGLASAGDKRRPTPHRHPACRPAQKGRPSMSTSDFTEVPPEYFEDLFIGNNLRDPNSMSLLFLGSPPLQRARSASSLLQPPGSSTAEGSLQLSMSESSSSLWATTNYSPSRFYQTSSSSYGSFAKLPALPNTTGHLRQPLHLATGVGAARG